MKRYFRLCSFQMVQGTVFKLTYRAGDDCWRASVDLQHWWFGKHYWHVLFLPDFMP